MMPLMRAGSSSGTFHFSQSGEKASTSTTPPTGAERRDRLTSARFALQEGRQQEGSERCARPRDCAQV